MEIVELRLYQLAEAPWNPNSMDEGMLGRLEESISRYGLVAPLVVRPRGDGYEVLNGNQRLAVLSGLGHETAPCIVIDVNDANARVLTQALNRLHGDDDLGLKAELIREVLAVLPEQSVLSLLPETSEGLASLAELGQGDIAGHLQAWEQAQAARLRHLTFQLVDSQRSVIEQAIDQAAGSVPPQNDNPNARGNALYEICQRYLEQGR